MINISSLAHFAASGIEYDTMRDEKARRKKGTVWLYGQSKFVRPDSRRRKVVSLIVFPREISSFRMSCTGVMAARESFPSRYTPGASIPSSCGTRVRFSDSAQCVRARIFT